MVCFTSLFGVYAGVVLLKTQSLIATILLHSYCNFLGPPRGNRMDLLGIGLFLVGWNILF
jgi:hypothetical protein